MESIMNKDELIGKKFGKLTVLGFGHHPDDKSDTKYVYRCECGNEGFLTGRYMMTRPDIACPKCTYKRRRSKREEVEYEF